MDNGALIDMNVERPFPISCGLRLSIEIVGIDYKLSSFIVGYMRNAYIIINMPRAEGVIIPKIKLFKGNKIIVRFLEGGTIFGFESDILGSIYDPVKLIIMSFPKIISRHELRHQKRYECFIPVALHKGDLKYNALIVDMSEEGFRLAVKVTDNNTMPEIIIGDQVIIHVVLPGYEGKFELSSEVMNFQQDNQRILLGMRAVGVSEEKRQTLNNYILFLEDIKAAD